MTPRLRGAAVVAVVAVLAGAAPAGARSATTGCYRSVVLDAAGDATGAGPVARAGPSDPTLDLVRADVSSGGGHLVVRMRVVQLAQTPARGQVLTTYLAHQGVTYAVVAARYADSSTGFTVRRADGSTYTTVVRGLQGSFDDERDTVVVPVPLDDLNEGAAPATPIGPGTVLVLRRVTSQRLDSPREPDLLGVPVDTAPAERCTHRVK